MPAPDAISREKLSRPVGAPRCPVILDARREAMRASGPRARPGVRRLDEADLSPMVLEDLAMELAGRSAIVVGPKEHGRSQGTAAWLRHHGVAAEHLEGGQAAWVAAGMPLLDPSRITMHDDLGRSPWVTRSRPKIDRIACPWLIRRNLAPRAQFLYVAPSEVGVVAERRSAMPYEVGGVSRSHRGELCTCGTLLIGFGLSVPALDRLAAIARGTDTARLDLAPEAAGLLAASLGLSRMYASDNEQLEVGMGLCDAFYRWARDATGETHNWPGVKSGVAQ